MDANAKTYSVLTIRLEGAFKKNQINSVSPRKKVKQKEQAWMEEMLCGVEILGGNRP